MTKNVTLRMDAELLRAVRHQAVDRHMSLSAWVMSLLARSVAGEAHYDKARRVALGYLDTGFRLGGHPLKREALHER
jgi:hypothetical protein